MSKLKTLFENCHKHPLLVAFISGLYPIVYAYNANFYMLSSWYQFGCFVLYFLAVPIAVTLLVVKLIGNIKPLRFFSKYALAGLNLFFFFSLLYVSAFQFEKKIEPYFYSWKGWRQCHSSIPNQFHGCNQY